MSKLKRVLTFIDWLLPGTLAVGPIKSVTNIVDQLDSRFVFLIINTNTNYKSNEPYEHVTPNIWSKYNEYTNIYYFAKESLEIRNLRKIIKET